MKTTIKVLVLSVSFISGLMTSVQAYADETTEWANVISFHVNDSYPDIVRVLHGLPAELSANPAGCEGDARWVDVEINKDLRSSKELDQIINIIYMSIALFREVSFVIDDTDCSPNGFRLAKGASIKVPDDNR